MRFNEVESSDQSKMDFVPREQRGQMVALIVAFIAAFVALVVASYLVPQTRYPGSFPAICALILGVFGLYVIFRRQQNLDLVMTTEYQNLLFAQAVSLGTSFCLFVRRDGTVVYANGGVRDLFPYFSYTDSQLLDAMFEAGQVPRIDRDRMVAAIQSGSTSRLVFPIQHPNGEKKEYVLTVEALARPAGFSVIRGREYLGQRTGTQLLPDMLRTTSPDKLDHLLARTPVGHFTTDTYGRLEYVNPALEKLLGYTPDSMVSQKLTLPKLTHMLANKIVGDDYVPGDFSGQAVLLQQDETPLPVLLFQHALRDSSGKIAGLTGTVISLEGIEHAAR